MSVLHHTKTHCGVAFCVMFCDPNKRCYKTTTEMQQAQRASTKDSKNTTHPSTRCMLVQIFSALISEEVQCFSPFLLSLMSLVICREVHLTVRCVEFWDTHVGGVLRGGHSVLGPHQQPSAGEIRHRSVQFALCRSRCMQLEQIWVQDS